MNTELIFGCVADDFTGASDAASFLQIGGLEPILFNGVPTVQEIIESRCNAAVVALKTRSVKAEAAVVKSLAAMRVLSEAGAMQYFIKYCSTFDSTPRGNIGPVVDAVMESYDIPYTIICPALPVNKRTVENGILYVDGVPLAESHMAHHPLNPMWDNSVVKLIEDQGKYVSLLVTKAMYYEKNADALLAEKIKNFAVGKKHFYIVNDYTDENDCKRIVDLFGNLKLLSGSSGLMTELAKRHSEKIFAKRTYTGTSGRALILSGSCSTMTQAQVKMFKQSGRPSYLINPIDVLQGKASIEKIWDFVKRQDEDTLVYTAGDDSSVREEYGVPQAEISSALERLVGQLAVRAVGAGFTRLIVAGGETSGAATQALGFNSYMIGPAVAPGIPVMTPLKNRSVRLVLKSGNFGQLDFFDEALKLTRGA